MTITDINKWTNQIKKEVAVCCLLSRFTQRLTVQRFNAHRLSGKPDRHTLRKVQSVTLLIPMQFPQRNVKGEWYHQFPIHVGDYWKK